MSKIEEVVAVVNESSLQLIHDKRVIQDVAFLRMM